MSKNARDWGVVAASFAVIFAFSSVDSAMSPMVQAIHAFYGVPMEQVLWLISWCTLGIVVGVLVGPALTASFRVPSLLRGAIAGLLLALALFLWVQDFHLALFARLLFGLSSGVLAACMWWLTFYGVSKAHYPAMVAVLMSARPLATALGVPLAGLVASVAMWQTPLWGFGAVIVLGGALLLWAVRGKDASSKKQSLAMDRLFSDYVTALRIPHAAMYYSGFTINRMCYFGFYAFAGIWSIRHYGLSLMQISSALFVIGLAEVAVNFFTPALVRRLGHGAVFLWSIGISAVVFPLFISGKLPLVPAIAAITVFMLLDRVYGMAAVVALPKVFPQAQNMTVFGSLNTLTAWLGLTVISWFQGKYLEQVGLETVQWILTACFLVGSSLVTYVQYVTVLRQTPKS